MVSTCILNDMNSNMKLIGIFILIILLSIVVIYFIYCSNHKHTEILEKFTENEASLTNYNYGSEYTGPYADSDKKKITGDITLRDCQVYFVGEDQQQDCDREYEANPNTTCKYVFKDDWKEIANIKVGGKTNSYPNKIYNQSYTKTDIVNHNLIAQCVKKFESENDKRYIYQDNGLIGYNYDGSTDGNTLELNYKLIESDESDKYKKGNFISMTFGNNDTPQTNYSNVISSICSKKTDIIDSLHNITENSLNPYFYKFSLDKNNKLKVIEEGGKYVPGIELVELDSNQNKFIKHDMKNFTVQSFFGIDFHSVNTTTVNFNVFKNVSLSDINCIVYKFEYHYLCDNNISSYITPLKARLHLKGFMDVETGVINAKKKFSVKNEPSIFTNSFWEQFRKKTPRISQKDNIIKILRRDKDNRISKLNSDSEDSKAINILQNRLTWYNDNKKTYEEQKNNFHKLSFTKLIDVKKDNYVDEYGITKINLNIKPYNYLKGYFLSVEKPQSSYDPRSQYKSIPPLISKHLKFKYDNSSAFGKVGLYGKRFSGYLNNYGNWKGKYGHNTDNKDVTDFNSIYTMGTGNAEYYTWYWSGYFYPHSSGNYYFHTNSDDASFVYLDDIMIVNNGGAHGMIGRNSNAIYLREGEYKKIEITFGERTGGDNIHFRWQPPDASWQSKASYNGKTWFYQNIDIDNEEKTTNLNFKFNNNDGSYYGYFKSQKNINIESIKIDNKHILKDSSRVYNSSEWVPITFKDAEPDNDYDFYIKGNLNRIIEVKATDKITTLKRKTYYIVTGNEVYEHNSGFQDVLNNKNLWWNTDNISQHHNDIHINRYETAEITITSFIYLQKGHYKFKADLGLPDTIIIKQSRITIGNTIIDENIEYNRNVGGFHMMSYSCIVLNNSSDTIDITFNFKVDFRSHNGKTIITNQDMNYLLYGGKKLYKDLAQKGFNDQFSNIKTFEQNTATDFNVIKETYLTPISGRGQDFWNLSNINEQIRILNESLETSQGKLDALITDIDTKYNAMILNFEDLDYETEFLDNIEYFDNVTVTYNSSADISDIIKHSTIDITSYITTEKMLDINQRTASGIEDKSFNYFDEADKSLYILKESITPPSTDSPLLPPAP